MSTLSLPRPAAPPRSRVLRHLVTAESRMVVRDSAGLVVPLGLPLLIMVMNGLSADDLPVPELAGMTGFSAVVVPLTVTMVLAIIGVVNMPSFLATYRTTGVLRRLAVTPTPPSLLLVAQALVSFVQLAIGVVGAVTIAVVAFGADLPRRPLVALGVVLLTTAAMYAVGAVVAAIAPTPNASVATGLTAFFAMIATGGGFGGRENLPEAVARVGEALPFGAGVEALTAAWTGGAPRIGHLLALAGCTLVAGAVAARTFRWDR